MDNSEAAQKFQELLPEQPLVGITNVAQNMADLRRYYEKAGFERFTSFALSYHAVTTTIEDQVTAQKGLRMSYFKQPQVLDTAIGIFEHKYTEPFRLQLQGKPLPPHWNVPMNHELMIHADKGIQAVIGYICHISGRDLAQTVYETEQTGLYDPAVIRDYVKYDYGKIDDSLALTARKLSPLLIENKNPKARDALVRLAMNGIVMGRRLARRDYRKLSKAKSEDERESILSSADQRAAKLAGFVLESSYVYQGLRDQFRNQPAKELRPLDPAA